MLNKVKTKALISVGAVAATSFILMMDILLVNTRLLNKVAKRLNWLKLNLSRINKRKIKPAFCYQMCPKFKRKFVR